MADGKWIEGLGPGTAPVEAARRVLEVRLRVVQEQLPHAMREPARDPEHVHQLRVATRRADAALRIFRDCLRNRAYDKARDRLRSLRRAAGAARDWDVFLLALAERGREQAAEEQPGNDFLIGYALGQRMAAQAQLEAVATELGPRLSELVRSTLEAVRQPHRAEAPATLLELARPLLADLWRDLEAAAAGDLKDYAHLHRVRILGKRLRYALEVFAGCFGPSFREELYPQVEEMQEVLGRANDSHVAAQRLAALRDRTRASAATWERFRPGVEGLLRFHQRRLPRERRRFVEWWSAWHQGAARAVLATLPGGPDGESG
jgi:CHAD domain-containing protein